MLIIYLTSYLFVILSPYNPIYCEYIYLLLAIIYSKNCIISKMVLPIYGFLLILFFYVFKLLKYNVLFLYLRLF